MARGSMLEEIMGWGLCDLGGHWVEVRLVLDWCWTGRARIGVAVEAGVWAELNSNPAGAGQGWAELGRAG